MQTSDEKELSRSASEFAAPVETVISLESSVQDALASLREKTIKQKIIYFYVVNEARHLKGVVSTRQLLLSDPNSTIDKIMQSKVIKLRSSQTLKEALELFERHSLLALPVVDQNGTLVGTIDVQTVMKESLDLADTENRNAVFQMIGLKLEEGRRVPLKRGYRLRMPWLLCNVFSGIVCAIVSRIYADVLGQFLLLAFFIPLVLTLSESSAMQSMTQSLHFIRRPRFSWRVALFNMTREWKLVGLLAISCGVLVGLLSLFWGDGFMPSFTIGIGIMISVAISSAFGILLPLVLFRMKLDPKVASGPVVLMIADMLTTAIYLSLATWWLL